MTLERLTVRVPLTSRRSEASTKGGNRLSSATSTRHTRSDSAAQTTQSLPVTTDQNSSQHGLRRRRGRTGDPGCRLARCVHPDPAHPGGHQPPGHHQHRCVPSRDPRPIERAPRGPRVKKHRKLDRTTSRPPLTHPPRSRQSSQVPSATSRTVSPPSSRPSPASRPSASRTSSSATLRSSSATQTRRSTNAKTTRARGRIATARTAAR